MFVIVSRRSSYAIIIRAQFVNTIHTVGIFRIFRKTESVAGVHGGVQFRALVAFSWPRSAQKSLKKREIRCYLDKYFRSRPKPLSGGTTSKIRFVSGVIITRFRVRATIVYRPTIILRPYLM